MLIGGVVLGDIVFFVIVFIMVVVGGLSISVSVAYVPARHVFGGLFIWSK